MIIKYRGRVGADGKWLTIQPHAAINQPCQSPLPDLIRTM